MNICYLTISDFCIFIIHTDTQEGIIFILGDEEAGAQKVLNNLLPEVS